MRAYGKISKLKCSKMKSKSNALGQEKPIVMEFCEGFCDKCEHFFTLCSLFVWSYRISTFCTKVSQFWDGFPTIYTISYGFLHDFYLRTQKNHLGFHWLATKLCLLIRRKMLKLGTQFTIDNKQCANVGQNPADKYYKTSMREVQNGLL